MVDFKALSAPFPPEEVYWRLGTVSAAKKRAMALAYIDARVVMDRLDDVCGPDGWQDRYPHAHTKTVCDIGIKCGDEWVWKSDGAGDSDIEAEKGSLSDAFKRAGVRWGIGRYLYHLKSPWVEVEETGQKQRDGKPIFRFTDAAKRELALIAARAIQPAAAPPPSSGPSSANGRRMAAAEPHLIDNNRTKGTLPAATTGPLGGRKATPEEARKVKVKNHTDKRVDFLNATKVWVRSDLDQYWTDNGEWIDWMSDPKNGFLHEYKRFTDAWNAAAKNARVVELA